MRCWLVVQKNIKNWMGKNSSLVSNRQDLYNFCSSFEPKSFPCNSFFKKVTFGDIMTETQNSKVVPLVQPPIKPRLYKRRWLMLLIYFIIVPVGAIQCSQYSIIANIIVDYYGVTYEAVNWTTLVTLLMFVIFVFPSCYLVDTYGIRNGALYGSCGAAVAAWIKVGSVSRDRFWVAMLGQISVSIPQIALLVLCPKIAANWFGPNEVAIANAVGLVGLQLGVALGFLLPPILIKKETVEKDLFTTAIALAVICSIAFILALIFLEDKPPIPPSHAALRKEDKIQYVKTIRRLLKNTSFLLVLAEVGCILGIFCSIQTMLNQVILKHYSDGAEDAGKMGLLMMILCIIGCFMSGAILSKYKAYRLCFRLAILCLAISLILFTYTLRLGILYPYVSCSLLGFFYGPFWNTAYEITVEITYPEPEAIGIGLTNACGQVLAISFTYFYAYLLHEVNDIWANNFLWITAFFSFILTLCTKYDLKRQSANLKGSKSYISLEMHSNV